MMLAYHNSSVSRALLDLFPNIGLDKSKFRTSMICLCVISTERDPQTKVDNLVEMFNFLHYRLCFCCGKAKIFH
jgi:hypothetical protein